MYMGQRITCDGKDVNHRTWNKPTRSHQACFQSITLVCKVFLSGDMDSGFSSLCYSFCFCTTPIDTKRTPRA